MEAKRIKNNNISMVQYAQTSKHFFLRAVLQFIHSIIQSINHLFIYIRIFFNLC
jgi:hypothetical protein